MADFSAAAESYDDDVEEFLWVEDEGEMGIPMERFTEVYDLMRSGNHLFRAGRFEEAISFYSKAQLLKPGDPIIISNRCITFCRISHLLMQRSASDSEHRPLNGLDPTTHAELALKDAEKVLSVRSNSPKSYLLKAKSLILLERYGDAREALLSGLFVDPVSHVLQTKLRSLENMTSDAVNKAGHQKLQRTDDFECTLCLKLLYEPVTTPCGHSFCRSCLLQAMDHGNRCPMCRTVLFISPRTYPISVTLNNIIQKFFSEEYAERKLEHESLANLGADLVPLFVMDVVLPCQKLSLNIFEPRYRLMVRRIMEGNHRMGMVIIDSATGSIADVACEVEIVECEPLPDGRFYLEVEGRRRFHILESWDQDGYRDSTTFTFQNKCSYTVWPATLNNANLSPLSQTGFELPSGAAPVSLVAPTGWGGRFWARTQCTTDSSGRFSCLTGDCGSGQVTCNGAGGATPTTLVEFTLQGDGGKDFYDISLVDGFNVPVSVAPQGGSSCNSTACPANINSGCPSVLSVTAPDGSVVGCKSACDAFNTDQYCCRGAYGTPKTCPPTDYSQIFKTQCPQAYSYAYDDKSSTFTCAGATGYQITFCP